jgi:two-component system LytT family response regulator
MKTIIIDDEKQARLALREEVEQLDNLTLIGEANGVKSGIQMIESLQPELVLLDIRLGDGMAFDLLEHFCNKKQFGFKVIMTTAYSDYALQAFKFSVVDYLLKPIDFSELSAAIQRIQEINPSEIQASIENFVYNSHVKDQKKRIAFHTSEGIRIEEINNIIRLNSVGNYTRIFFNDSTKLMISKPLKEYNQLLSQYHFFRIHASHLINMNWLKSYNPKNNGEVTLTNGDVLPVSQRKRTNFLKELENYSI